MGVGWGLGVGTAQLPKPPPPPEPLPTLVVRMGTGALMGVAKGIFFLDFFFFCLVPALSPLALPRISMLRQERTWTLGRAVVERAGKIEAS